MKYRELVEGQSHTSNIFCWNLLQLNNEDYQKILKQTMDKADEEVPEKVLADIRKLPYP